MQRISLYKSGMLSATIFLVIVLVGCTKNFEKYNTDTTGVTDEQLLPDFNSIGAFFPSMEQSLIPMNDPTTADIGEYLMAGNYSGYIGSGVNSVDNRTYYHLASWDTYSLFNLSYNFIMSPIGELRRRNAETISPDFWAVALVIKVAGLHKATDTYGPIPYSQFGKGGTSVPYDSQQSIYTQMFTELDTATSTLLAYTTLHPGVMPFKKFDVIYGGDYTKWLKLANSLRLRLAMHIVKVDLPTAKLQAEKALDPANGGVLAANSDNAVITGQYNWLAGAAFLWGDIRSGAAILSYMNGYNDPRMSILFAPSTILPGQYIGIRAGSQISSQAVYNTFSNFNSTTFTTTTPGVYMNAAEVYFLRAEGVLRGWNMGGGTAQQYYESGITNSFTQWGIPGAATAYLSDGTSHPADFTDPVLPINSSPALSQITIQWKESAPDEEKLERITTQKWLANFPNGTEAWTTFRRTGYPKLFPVVVNNSGGTVNTNLQIKREWYPSTEYNVNSVEVTRAVSTLLGGPDNGGTRLWWDINAANF
jgi:hypothetical protein